MVSPWVSVSPDAFPAAILGPLPMMPGSVAYAVPRVVVPETATGLLVFAWCAISGANLGPGHWHIGVNTTPFTSNWFALMGVGSPTGGAGVGFNSQAFWLPMPLDGMVRVTLGGAAFPSPLNRGQVEIHGYMPAIIA